jgi:hypothetical protein
VPRHLDVIYVNLLTNTPTVIPAAIDGTEPVLMYPKVPPPAVRAPRMNAGVSIP